MKKLSKTIQKYLSLFTICVVSLCPLSIVAQTVNGISYQVIDESAKTVRTGYFRKSSDGNGTEYYKAVGNSFTGFVTIPPKIIYNGVEYTVTEIGPRSFSNTKISGIELPETITSIEEAAFDNCANLSSINMPSSLQRIESNAFRYCSFSKVIIQDIASWCNVKKKSYLPAQHLYSDKYSEVFDLSIPNGVTMIESLSFSNFKNIKTVTLPNSLTSIGDNAFAGCSQLTILELPEFLRTIGDFAFRDCQIKYFVIPQTVESIGIGALDYLNVKLEKIYSSISSPETIAGLKRAFTYISNGISLYVPIGTKELYENSIGSMTFSIIEEIGNPAVAFVQREKDILITEFLIEDKDNAQFGFGLSSAVSDTINGFYSVPITVKKWDKTYIISSIGKNAFTNCTYIDSIYVPKTITKIGKSFINCSALRSFAIGNRNPTSIRLDENCFEDIYNAVLYVPAGTKERYEALEPWSKFSQIIESSPISAGDISARFGSKTDMPIYLKNTETVEGLQFKLTLPDGVSVEEQDGTLLAATTERTEGMTIMGRKDPDAENSYLFVVLSLDGNAISGTEGAIMNVRLDIAHDMELGVHDIKVEDVYMTTSTFETLNPAESTSELTIKDFMPGDVNNDGIVNVTDAIGIVNHVLKNTPETFIEGAADVNQDRIVNVTDAIGIINMILNK